MKIARICAYRVALPLHEGSYKWSGGKSVTVFDSTIVEVETDAGVTATARSARWARSICRPTPGARAGIAELGPHLLGRDPRELGQLNRRMDAALKGHPYVKSGIDMACWDILGKARACRSACCWAAASARRSSSIAPSPRSRRQMAAGWPSTAPRATAVSAQGRRRSRRGHRPHPRGAREAAAGRRLVADANTGWLMHDAMRVVRAVRDVDVYIEQPCLTYEECLAVRRHTDHPFVLDENIDSIDMLLRANADRAMDVVNLKISKLGGLTKTRQVRDLCVSLGIAMTLEDSWGGDITTAAIAHLAHSTPEALRFTATDFNSYVTVSTAEGAPKRQHGRMAASTAPGLGVTPRMRVLGKPVVEVAAPRQRR